MKRIPRLALNVFQAMIHPMETVTLNEAQKHLPELVRKLGREGELLITDDEKPVAKLSAVPAIVAEPPIHAEVIAITGLLPQNADTESEYLRHVLHKHR